MAHIYVDNYILRPIEIRDLSSIYDFRNDWEVVNSVGGFSIGYSTEAVERWIRSAQEKNDHIIWAIAEKDTDLCVGHVGLYEIDYRVRKANSGTIIGDKTLWGKGLGTKIRKEILDFAFNQLNLNRIQCTILESNIGSIKVSEKLGFKKEGILREYQYRDGKYQNAIIMSILKSDWLELYKS